MHATQDMENLGIYHCIKILSDTHADKLSKSSKRRKEFLSRSYEILLKRKERLREGLPAVWEVDDVINAIQIEIWKKCRVKGNWTESLCNKVMKQMEYLRNHKDNSYFQDCVSPALRMLLCIEYYQHNIPSPEKELDRFFDKSVIPRYLDNLKLFKLREDVNTFPLHQEMRHSQSDGLLQYWKSDSRCDRFFQVENSSNDLDEGFVTPNEDHIERSPCDIKKPLPVIHKGPNIRFYWDYQSVSLPPNRHKNWEKYDTIGKLYKEGPFMKNNILMNGWLSTGPKGVNISKEVLFDHLLVLLVGVPSLTFVSDGDNFIIRDGVYTEDLTPAALSSMCQQFIQSGKAFNMLKSLCESYSDNSDDKEDAITLSFKLALREYLYKYQSAVISAKENFMPAHTCYFSLITALDPFMQQITILDKLLATKEELRGISFLQFLFKHLRSSSNSAINYVLSSLFFLPCTYYFRLIDDWIFLGHWHQDLPLNKTDMTSVNDRQSWLEAYKPKPNQNPWLVPSYDLGYCGKAISLLSLSKSNAKFLEFMKSDRRLKLRLSLNAEDLIDLRKQCRTFYEEGLKYLRVEEKPKADLVVCARTAALTQAAEFKTKQHNAKLEDIKKKQVELELREKDLAESRLKRERRRENDRLEDERVAAEQVEILFKERQAEIEKSKIIFERFQMELEWESKRISRAEWKIKREALNEKRKEFFSNELKSRAAVITNVTVFCNQDFTTHPEEAEKIDESKSLSITPQDLNSERNSTLFTGEANKSDSPKTLSRAEPIENRSNIKDYSIYIDNEYTQEDTSNCKDTSSNSFNCVEKLSDLEKNRMKVLRSDFMDDNMQDTAFIGGSDCGNHNKNIFKSSDIEGNNIEILGSHLSDKNIEKGELSDLVINTNRVLGSSLGKHTPERKLPHPEVNKIEISASDLNHPTSEKLELSDLEKNKNKILGSDFDLQNNILMQGDVNRYQELTKIQHKKEDLSELVRNRMKILGSDLGGGEQMGYHIWDKETERNKQYMLQSHLPFFIEYNQTKAEESVTNPTAAVGENTIAHPNNESEKIALDIEGCEQDKNGLDSNEVDDAEEYISNWRQILKPREDEKMKNIFNGASEPLIPREDIDYTFLHKLVPQSLRIVLDTQTKLLNRALLNMFLEEFDLLKVTQKLREYFFLHGEFGKRLSSSLSKAIEVEEPSTLLTFYKLRNILAEASRGDIKEISFLVKDTPVAFEHTSSQVLSCLGLTYKFEWPLNLVFTDKAISKYNNVFLYMFSLQRVMWHLEKVWHVLHLKPAFFKGYQYTQIQLYRHVMSQFVSTLQAYIVTTVIENSWQDFIKDIPKIENIDQLYRRHAVYIKDIITKCFLDERSKKLMGQIETLLHYILVFCRANLYGEWKITENEEFTHSNFEKLRSTFSSFLSLARCVTKNLDKIAKVNYKCELENLCSFLTINSFYVS